MFPKVLHIDINQTEEDLNGVIAKLHNKCQQMHRNISTRKMEEYIFEHHDGSVTILAGKGSARKYLHNFMKRLAENFYNLKWILGNLNDPNGTNWILSNIEWIQKTCPENDRDSIRKLLLKEFKIYEDTYLRLRDLYLDNAPQFLKGPFDELRNLLYTEEKK